MYKRPARLIQIDLVSTCSARRLRCYRQTTVGKENIHYVKNVHVDPKAFRLALQDPYFDNLEEILFCGNYGDPMASPHLIKILDYLDELKPHLGLMFHTNGSLVQKSYESACYTLKWARLICKICHRWTRRQQSYLSQRSLMGFFNGKCQNIYQRWRKSGLDVYNI